MVSTPEASPTMVSSSSLAVHQQQESSRSPMVYIFINPTSGSNRASEYLTLGLQHMRFRDNTCDVYIFDISDGVSGSKPAFVQLAAHGNTRDASHPIRVLVAGGDGTIMWFLDEAIKHSVDIDSIAIGVIPFGTANDFSRTLGWGAQASRVLLGKRLSNLKDMLAQWLDASIVPYDIWEVEISCTASGSIQQVKKSVKTPLRNEGGEAKRVGVECGINSHGGSSSGPDILGKLQDPGDGKLELMSYDALVGLSAEQLRIAPFAGNGQRLYQGGGPVVLHFKSLGDSIRTYFQIDGEYFMCKHPDTITIRTWLKRWLSADVEKYDIWKVEVKLQDDDGFIYQLKNGEKAPLTKVEGNATDRTLKTLAKPMCNYFSTGVESRLRLGFDRNRKKHQFAYKLL
ncbi:hypothetical protein FOL46_006064 [Perkinsus olseni]|uniref:DAGKc domain-containing protein n=1 Tax=Perkinsus olseni TaxID=32597 RepID=A0A7J6LMU7_PEROL|nr:hypothetical protein FOL46_006064 [Perkinsus olseni]